LPELKVNPPQERGDVFFGYIGPAEQPAGHAEHGHARRLRKKIFGKAVFRNRDTEED
jgi:hypothetical protein